MQHDQHYSTLYLSQLQLAVQAPPAAGLIFVGLHHKSAIDYSLFLQFRLISLSYKAQPTQSGSFESYIEEMEIRPLAIDMNALESELTCLPLIFLCHLCVLHVASNFPKMIGLLY